MSRSHPQHLPLAIAFVLSLVLHAVAAALLVHGPDRSASMSKTSSPDASAEVTPGIESSPAVTVSWIGFEDPTPHTAPKAESDQAQVSPDAGEAARLVASATLEAAKAAEQQLAPLLERGSVFAEALRDQAIVAQRQREAREASQRAAEARKAREQAEGDRPALPDQRDAAATSTQTELVYRAGKPLARQGLQVITVRPEFDAATSVLDLRSVRTDPVVLIAFARDGTARHVTLVDGGTGLRSVDEPITTAVYRWTARGADLEALPEDDPDATLTIRIRFDL